MLTATTTRTRLFASALAPGAGQSFGLGVSDVFTEQPAKPQTPGSEHAPQAGSVEASPSKAGRAPHRLLYRGALSLPDSHITLDGLTFVASQSEHGRGSSGGGMLELLDNPLALALESMRGRPTISLLGEQRLDAVHDKWIDEAGDVSMYVVSHHSVLCLIKPDPGTFIPPLPSRVHTYQTSSSHYHSRTSAPSQTVGSVHRTAFEYRSAIRPLRHPPRQALPRSSSLRGLGVSPTSTDRVKAHSSSSSPGSRTPLRSSVRPTFKRAAVPAHPAVRRARTTRLPASRRSRTLVRSAQTRRRARPASRLATRAEMRPRRDATRTSDERRPVMWERAPRKSRA
jgi:hypothetical protein